MSQSPSERISINDDHPYAEASRQLNRLVRLGHAFSGHERNCVYLNTGDGSFANASGVSGMDFDDDGRAIAFCDWDYDGDVDCWVANRTAPQIRLMCNQLSTNNHFLALRLEGATVNRDAIGAQVRVACQSEAERSTRSKTILKSVRAGEGYLGQSSKWLHFGLGNHRSISKLEVRWPGGEWRSLPGELPIDGFYRLRQNQNMPERVERPRLTIQTSDAAPTLSIEGASAKLLLSPLPLPPLPYSTVKTGERADASLARQHPVLLTLWAPWCGNCRKEFAEWNHAARELKQTGLEVLAVNVDGLSHNSTESIAKEGKASSPNLTVPHESCVATQQLVALMQLVNDVLIYRDDHRPLPIPTTWLIDKQGRLAAIYKGPAPIDQVLSDLKTLQSDGESQADAALPFPGRWLATPAEYQYEKFVARLWEEQLGDSSLTYTKRLAGQLNTDALHSLALRNARGLRDTGKPIESKKLLAEIVSEAPKHTAALTELGVLAGRSGELASAVAYLQTAVASAPDDVTANFNLGLALRKQGKLEEARSAIQKAVVGDSRLVEGHAALGALLARTGRFSEAADAFGRAFALQPQNPEHAFNQTTALIQLDEFDQALALLGRIPASDSLMTRITRYRGEIYERQGKLTEAASEFRRLLASAPDTPPLLFRIAQLCERSTQYAEALDAYQRLLVLAPDDPIIESRVAWIMASAPQKELRDGKQAVRLALKASASTKRTNPLVLDALAAAYAELGDFPSAASAIDEAIVIATADKRASYVQELTARKQAYDQQKPHRLQQQQQPTSNKP